MEEKNCPKVSVIMPAYNASEYLAEAIDSVLAQTYPNIEILVINDGSKDDGATERVALSYGDKIRYFAKENGGVSSALNLGIDNMTGDYFSWLSHDDAYTPDKIACQVAAIQKLEDKRAVALCSHIFIDKDSKPIAAHKAITPAKESRLLSAEEALFFMLNHGSYNGCAFLIPKDVFAAGLRFREDLRYSQDMLMWTHIFLNGSPMLYTTDESVLSRIHAAQQTQTKRGLLRHDSLEIAREIAGDLAELSQDYPLLYAYAKRNATLNNKEAYAYAKSVAKEHKLFSLAQKLSLFGVSLYGSVRPMIRRIYYRIFIKTKTQ